MCVTLQWNGLDEVKKRLAARIVRTVLIALARERLTRRTHQNHVHAELVELVHFDALFHHLHRSRQNQPSNYNSEKNSERYFNGLLKNGRLRKVVSVDEICMMIDVHSCHHIGLHSAHFTPSSSVA